MQASAENGICEDFPIALDSTVKQLKFAADNQAVYVLSDRKVSTFTNVDSKQC